MKVKWLRARGRTRTRARARDRDRDSDSDRARAYQPLGEMFEFFSIELMGVASFSLTRKSPTTSASH